MGEFLEAGLEAVAAAEAVLLQHFGNYGAVELKADRSPVTAADKEAERVIIGILKERFPDHGFFGEEGGDNSNGADYVWVIDPLDGTKNYIRGLPFFSTELALAHKGTPRIGVSNMPLVGGRLWAERGKGTFLNGKQVNVSAVGQVEGGLVIDENRKFFERDGIAEAIDRLDREAYASRNFGGYSFRAVAAGTADAALFAQAHYWDVAAATVIVEAAGGRATGFFGRPIGPGIRTALLTNGKLHTELLGRLAEKTARQDADSLKRR